MWTAGALALCLAGAAHAENWFAFYMIPQGVAYVDKDSIIFRPGHVSARVQSTYPRPQQLQKGGQIITFSKSVDTLDIDCKADVYRFVSRTVFNDAGQEQVTVSEEGDVFPILERSQQDVLEKAYCPKTRK